MTSKQQPPPASQQAVTSRAKRVAGWTTNFIAIGLVVVIAVGIGRQLVEWYGLEEVPVPSPMELPLSALEQQRAGEPARLEFGDQGYSLVRDTLTGDRDAAVAKLIERCRMLLESAGEPARPPGKSELNFLQRSADRTPLAEQAGRWEIHQFEGDFPLLVAIGHVKPRAKSPTARSPSLEQPARRVLAWGLAVPAGEQAWNLYVYQAAGASDTQGSSAVARQLPLPDGCRRTLSLAGNHGETTTGIAGDALPQQWIDGFDQGYRRLGWTSDGWRHGGGAWQVRYDSPQNNTGHVEVQFHETERGRLVGLVLAFPGADTTNRGDR